MELAAAADVRIDGDRPWDLRVRDERLYGRVFAEGSLGLGDAYVEGWWDCPDLDEFFRRVFAARLHERVGHGLSLLVEHVKALLVNEQSPARSRDVALKHYDLGNDLYRSMLDRRMNYSCGYWKDARDLDEAQEAKLDLICRKIGLRPGQRVLDIGCGWGGFATWAAERHGAEVVGVTISKKQQALAAERCRGLPVEIRLQDYRELDEPFDRVVSIGMFEHVGVKNYRTYFEVARRCLKKEGLFLLHTIGGLASRETIDPWIDKRIFPHAMLPSAAQIGRAVEGLFLIEDWHNFGPDYALTLRAWHDNFERAWGALRERYGESFRRMWRFYLLSCAALFETCQTQLWQIVLSPEGVPKCYRAVR
jgi:cyclopropane-fatty-acyl-phospholipid synthase